MEPSIAKTPDDGYYAVIFTSLLSDETEGYEETAMRMIELAQEQPGYLGVETARGPDGLGITVSYWDSPEAIAAWKKEAEHRAAQRMGREKWYRSFCLRIAKVERAYGFGD